MIKRISFDPHVIREICRLVIKMKKNNSECHSAKCEPCLYSIERLLEEKEVIDVPENNGYKMDNN